MVAAVGGILESKANGRLDPGAAAHTRLGTGFLGGSVFSPGPQSHPSIPRGVSDLFISLEVLP